jgi:flagellar basal body-associated protein FliL
MSDNNKKDSKPADPAAKNGEAAPQKGGLPIKMLGIVGVIMVVQAAGVYMLAKSTAPQAASAAEAHLSHADQTDHEEMIELLIVEDRFQNMQTGRVWVWDVDIVLKVRAKNEEAVTKVMEARAAEITEGVSMIFRRAHPTHLREEGLETLNRQLLAFLDGVFGKDAENKSRIERVVIPKCKGFPAE